MAETLVMNNYLITWPDGTAKRYLLDREEVSIFIDRMCQQMGCENYSSQTHLIVTGLD